MISTFHTSFGFSNQLERQHIRCGIIYNRCNFPLVSSSRRSASPRTASEFQAISMESVADLSRRVKGDVITPKHPEYAQSIHRWAKNAERNAAVVVFVKNEADVSAAILHARANKLPIAIRGGGHNAVGASSIEGGLVIDLSRYLADVRVDAEKKLAFVGGGALWETVDKVAIGYGLATVGGTVNHTGVGGLILGGGFGWLSGEYGLTIDNLVQVTIVGADGTARKASNTENPDLFFGVRGGGSNFGVVTEFVLALHNQRKTVFAGPVIFPTTKLKEVVEFAREWYANIDPKEAMLMMTTTDPDGTPIIPCLIFYNGTEEEGRAKFKKLYEIGPVADMAKEIPYEELNALQNPMVPHGNGVYLKGVAHEGPNYDTILKAHEKVTEFAKGGKFMPNAIYEWYPLRNVNSVSPSTTAHRRIPNPNCLIVVAWPGNTHSEEKVDEARVATHAIAACVAGGEAKLKEISSQGYSNYDPEGITGEKDEVRDKAQIAFGENYPTLRELKRKYDPENTFNKWFAITPA